MNDTCVKLSSSKKCKICGQGGLFYIIRQGVKNYWCASCNAENPNLVTA